VKLGGYAIEYVESAEELFRTGQGQPEICDVFPFLRREWLIALEGSGAACAETGWHPFHLRFRKDGQVRALVPGYLKTHSMGEFVFDQAIAEFAERRLGIQYYPKLIFGIPFTPATAPRVMAFDPEEVPSILHVLADLVPELCRELRLSSAHCLFGTESDVETLKERGFLRRSGIQYQFKNRGLSNFDDYLAQFRAKRRAQIRRERRELTSCSLDVYTGSELATLDPNLLYQLYLTTVDKYVWGRRYLNLEFFRRVTASMPEALHVVLARDAKTREPIAGTFNLLGREALYGRYWGTFREVPFLHFEVCLYRGVEETITRGLSRFEPGAGGEHKEARGFEPTLTQSAHFFSDQRLFDVTEDFFAREHQAIVARMSGPDSSSSEE
jgi:uncharacterized protein